MKPRALYDSLANNTKGRAKNHERAPTGGPEIIGPSRLRVEKSPLRVGLGPGRAFYLFLSRVRQAAFPRRIRTGARQVFGGPRLGAWKSFFRYDYPKAAPLAVAETSLVVFALTKAESMRNPLKFIEKPH